MATRNERLAALLARISAAARKDIVRSTALSARDINAAKRAGFLHEIVRGWYVLATPDAAAGTSTLYYGSYWSFISQYLAERFDQDYVLSPDASLNYHLDQTGVPRQIIIQIDRPQNGVTPLPHNTSLLFHRMAEDLKDRAVELDGLQVLPLPLAIARVAPVFYTREPQSAELALRLIRRPDEFEPVLARSGRVIAGRLVGAYRHIGMNNFAEQLLGLARAEGIAVEISNPFDDYKPSLADIESVRTPYVGRMQAMWASYRKKTMQIMGEPRRAAPKTKDEVAALLKRIETLFTDDAYNSLSIEGYRVTPELIAKIASGNWQDNDPADTKSRDTMAAKGYHDAYKMVLITIEQMCTEPERAAQILSENYGLWRRQLFLPLRDAGLLQDRELVGYRDHPVYILDAIHVPPPQKAVIDCMDAFDELLRKESSPAVRAILGHFMFVFIHPYADGNGRTARFVMNAQLCAAGYAWTVIPVQRRKEYFAALKSAATERNIEPFAAFISAIENAAAE